MTISNVAIIGSIHGNERAGAYLLKRWVTRKDEITRPSFNTNLMLGNPRALAENRRFIDEDLNRAFSSRALAAGQKPTYEAQRAAEIYQQIGPREDPVADLIIDLHTSTSSCGMMLVLFTINSFNLQMCAFLSERIPGVHIVFVPAADDAPYMNSISSRHLGVEVGPNPHGVVRSPTIHLMRDVVQLALDFVEHFNQGTIPALPGQIEVFEVDRRCLLPELQGEVVGFVHRSVDGADYLPIHPGDPVFETIDGEVILFDGAETVYPVFVNEAAYFADRLGFFACSLKSFPVG